MPTSADISIPGVNTLKIGTAHIEYLPRQILVLYVHTRREL